MRLNWTKGLFSSTYKIKEDGDSIGYLKLNPWGSKAIGELKDQKFLFISKGAFSTTVKIVDPHTGNRIGEMRSKSFSAKKIIDLKGEKPLYLESEGFFSKKWFLKSKDSDFIEFIAKDTKGEVKMLGPFSELMVLSGLYGINQHFEYAAVVVAIIVAIIAAQ